MTFLIAQSYLFLVRIEILIRFNGLPSVHALLRNQSVATWRGKDRAQTERLCHAMDLACVFYPKRVLCLQRSAATVLLLRRHGLKGELVIGAQVLPFKSHAWVEIDGIIVNDKPYTSTIYQTLERC
jgi:hypothetical protein